MSKVRIKFNENPKAPNTGADVSLLSKEVAEKVRAFHRTFPAYAPTPLARLTKLASHLGLGEVLVKDESYRFGLNAFKVLGGSYAVGKILAEKLGKDISEVSCEYLRSQEASDAVGDITFASTTDGNHGRGLAWAAEQFNKKAIIYMPKGSAPVRRDNIKAHGAECTITELNYDDCVRMASEKAQENGWVTVQDTAWEGYTEIPNAIMQGYTTLALEALEQMQGQEFLPTHIFLQAGVGCFAGAMLGFFMSVYGEKCPKFIIVEPDAANCYYVSACAEDGKPHTVDGDLLTLMAGLACGEPNLTSWEMLLDYPVAFASCEDKLAATGMRVLGAPIKGDPPVTSGESGAATMGLLYWLMQTEEGREAKERLELNENSTVLCFSTEGDTSPELYKEIMWSCKNSL
ncbi:diaminopropionate ammonia-lyase [Halodesulfovibrio spirochaetisodalis]|uniref:Diaminopropionate ammonia-lyase n=1 Tax=Halodesulfovibrio spirochaetisodalis TaxID=1560234 RepID=A0A1B7XIE0_9BACT|nr:diaminopropionate ammonia-lyase [Halodesulfovibrio spirochaetisodalis]OBQ55241.1 diaminopropionate ammonia-lyase [Halodesulfovibrio spirochaetisodalis]